MIQKILLYIFLFSSCFIIISCNINTENKNDTTQEIRQDNSNYKIIADTIITNVLIKNNDPDNTWQEYCLRDLDKDILINRLFEAIYSKEIQAYNFFSDDSMSISEIRKLENTDEFNRSLVAKVQFEEKWLLDERKLSIHKEVHSIMLAYEIFNSKGEIRGYKPAFKVYLKNN